MFKEEKRFEVRMFKGKIRSYLHRYTCTNGHQFLCSSMPKVCKKCFNRPIDFKEEYCNYQKMKARCYSPNHHKYYKYGARGIKICDRWLGKLGFHHFIMDMGKRPFANATIDRINNNGNYEPNNCQWLSNQDNGKKQDK